MNQFVEATCFVASNLYYQQILMSAAKWSIAPVGLLIDICENKAMSKVNE